MAERCGDEGGDVTRPECCPTCGGTRYCAPARCYCGHESCPAFASFVDMASVPLTAAPTVVKAGPSSWDKREESTWIDSL